MNLLNLSFLKLLFAGALLFPDWSGTRTISLPPSFQVIVSEKNFAISTKEARFELHFKNLTNFESYKKDIKVSCNGVNLTASADTSDTFIITVVPGKYQFQFYYNENYYEITTDSIEIKPGFITVADVRFRSSIEPVIMFKPVIYVYPQKPTDVSIKLSLKGELDFTYPLHKEEGWQFLANPDGSLEVDGQKHNYLFWEGKTDLNLGKIALENGFVVEKTNVVSFFEEKLSKMGLNPNEKEDFITYWGPILSRNDRSYVHFMFNETYDEYAHLEINPKPDQLFRVFMLWSPIGKETELKIAPQSIPSFKRNGFSIVEWGGTQINELPPL